MTVSLTQVRFCAVAVGAVVSFVGLFSDPAAAIAKQDAISKQNTVDKQNWFSYSRLNVDVLDLYWSGLADVEIPEDTDTVRTVIDELENSPLEPEPDDLTSSGERPVPILPITD
jgi:hypothetical protein